ncbi:MAG: hypothetical protein RLZZ422_305 [Pseudomonadota bacterium]|jgi:uncharacterized protein YoxC
MSDFDFYSESFLNTLKTNKYERFCDLLNEFNVLLESIDCNHDNSSFNNNIGGLDCDRTIDLILETYLIIEVLYPEYTNESYFQGTFNLENQYMIRNSFQGFMQSLKKQINLKLRSNRLEHLTKERREILKFSLKDNIFYYEFSQSEVEKIQVLINELRSQISSCTLFEEPHRERLLKRLEKLQQELHKKLSNLDTFWGVLGDAGVAIGKFGNDVKPIVDRMKELTKIVWEAQSKAEQLPADTPPPALPSS